MKTDDFLFAIIIVIINITLTYPEWRFHAPEACR